MSHHDKLMSVKNAAPTVQMAFPGCLEMNHFTGRDMLDELLRYADDKCFAAGRFKVRAVFRQFSASRR